MEKLVSMWYKDGSLPENYVFPPETRPGKSIVPTATTIPVIDLSQNRFDTIQKILEATREFGFFQVINHGVAEKLIKDTMNVFKEFFDMPAEDRVSLFSDDPRKSTRLFTSNLRYHREEIHFWRDVLKHPCHPLEECIQHWPEKPSTYRNQIRESLLLSANHYPPCPDPSLTLGLPKHCDPNLITILLQGDVSGLQVFKDGEWIGVDPLPNAFVINVGYALQIISNNKVKSVEHRAVTNSKEPRISAAFFVDPANDCIIEPAKALTDASNPPIYRPFHYKEFIANYISLTLGNNTVSVLEQFKDTCC